MVAIDLWRLEVHASRHCCITRLFHNEFASSWRLTEAFCVMQPAYKDADSTAIALQAAAPVGVKEFRTERLQLLNPL